MSQRESANLKNKLNSEGEIIRGSDSIITFNENAVDSADFDESQTCLFRLEKNQGKFYVVPKNTNMPNDRLWVVIRSLKEGYTIKKHDIIKLGRMKFRVKEYRTKLEYFEDHDNWKSPHPGFEEHYEVRRSPDDETNCRFCWTSEQQEDNPLIGACKWDGSIKFIHFKCIKMWLQTKVTKKEGPSHCTLNWKNFEWELCKTPYPYTFKLEEKRWFLVDLSRPEDKDTPYIILESLSSEKNSSRTIHCVVINTDQLSFSLGRGHDSELRINDISVSRKHASLEYKDNSFLLTDLKSKFGTLMLTSDDIELSEQNSKTFQIGRTVVTIKSKSETPWKKKNYGKGLTANNEFKGEDLQRMEELLRDTKSLGNKKYDSDKNYQKQITHDIVVDNIQKVSSSEVNRQDNNVIEIDGKRYIILKELDDDQDE
jgi:pSer/pThr/pTyr-binding forkhead associated (FHA) protein